MIKNFEELKNASAKCAACLDAKFTGNDGKRHLVLCGGTGCLSSRSDEITVELKKRIEEKGLSDEYNLYALIEELAPEVIARERKIYKGVSANVDFYSGFVYDMLDLPHELYTPIFAIARIAGWSAHRIEEILNAGKIIRPAYKAVQPHRDYISLDKR